MVNYTSLNPKTLTIGMNIGRVFNMMETCSIDNQEHHDGYSQGSGKRFFDQVQVEPSIASHKD